ncbi:uncharacterized protein LOC126909684 [Daktulosphaira vitifoliae]|uniref:Odorant binding protein 3 n=1 Tax=Daktulosphaira vitifoliae TaxID=58002 RepID=A0A1W6R6D8_DAKVI|nr:uncharacterized protein LOC126909684 [Daktulosphaira vitifoliae]ARO50002.1 odorant binding protein 3 [Daktulosphaira vitifoliae]
MDLVKGKQLFYSLILLSITILVCGRFTPEQIDFYGKECNASQEDLQIAKEYKVPTSELGKCLMKCMISKLGMLNSDGTYNKTGTFEALKQYWQEWPIDKVELINNKCHSEASKASPDVIATCNYAFEVMACINIEAKTLGVL